MPRIYFDHSATTPVDERVVVTMNEFMLEKFGNPSSIHGFGREARRALEEARATIAGMLNCSDDEVYFTSGGTEADNLALIGYSLYHRNDGDHVIISNIEHPAVLKAADELERLGFAVTRIPADRYGSVFPEAILEALTDRTILVSAMHINNEIGTVNDIGAIGSMLRQRGIRFHTDAVQSFGKAPLDVQAMGIDILSLSSHKIYGPKGVGAIYIRKGIEIQPRVYGGHQERGIRSGTENLPGIIGLGKAASICRDEMDSEAQRLSQLRDGMYTRFSEEMSDVSLNGHPTKRLPGNLNLSFHGVEGEALLVALDLEGIAVSSGSACSSGSTQPSHVLTAIGLPPEEAQATLRITLGRSNTDNDVEYAIRVIIDNVNRLREMSGVRPAAQTAADSS